MGSMSKGMVLSGISALGRSV